jgi:YbbR domain-containing protein
VSEERGEVSLVADKEIINYKKKGEFRQSLERWLVPGQSPRDGTAGGPLSWITSNWRLKILSLCTALFLWFAFVGPQRSEVGMSVPIQYTNLPSTMELTGKWMDRIDVMIRGSGTGLAHLTPGSVRAVVDLSGVLPGLNYYKITNKNLLVPPGITISQIRPSDLHLNIEAASTKNIGVVPTLSGALPENAKVTVTPSEVRIRAVQGDLKRVTSVTTEPVNVSELTAKGKIVIPVLVKPDGLRIDSIEPVQVTVALEGVKS